MAEVSEDTEDSVYFSGFYSLFSVTIDLQYMFDRFLQMRFERFLKLQLERFLIRSRFERFTTLLSNNKGTKQMQCDKSNVTNAM